MADDLDKDVDPTRETERRQLGPGERSQEAAGAQEPDPRFAQALRARLTGEAAAATRASRRPVPVLEPTSRPRSRRFRPIFLGALVAAAVAAALVALVIDSRRAESPAGRRAAALPRPSRTDLTRTFPLSGGLGAGGARLAPWRSLLAIPSGSPYTAHLSLSASSLGRSPTTLRAFRLAGPAYDATRVAHLARALGIHGALKRTAQRDGTWVYAADSLPGSRLHSLAVNLSTGELIYHDRRNRSVDRRPAGLNARPNVVAARAFMRRLGWPPFMPAHRPSSPQESFLRNTVTLGWPLAGWTDAPEAILLVDKGGRVVEARAWPPVDRIYFVSARQYAAAWTEVLSGRAPVAVQLTPGETPRGGSGTIRRVELLEVLTTGAGGRRYLVPAYRFNGPARITGIRGTRTWLAVVPAHA